MRATSTMAPKPPPEPVASALLIAVPPPSGSPRTMGRMKHEPVIVGVKWRRPIDVRLFAQVVLDVAAKQLAEERDAEADRGKPAVIVQEPPGEPGGSTS